jgi:hypothetical protein
VYNNWSAYDELSDRIPLTEELAMREFAQIVRLRQLGVHFDYYMMDAFWFDPDGAYRTWRTPTWPNGPDRWIAECRRNGILPGLWFSTNTLVKINAAPQWQDSLNKNKGSMSFYEGGFLPDFMTVLQYWYDRGIRMFKFDFADFAASTPNAEKTQTGRKSAFAIKTHSMRRSRSFARKILMWFSRDLTASVATSNRRMHPCRSNIQSTRGGSRYSMRSIPATPGLRMFRR